MKYIWFLSVAGLIFIQAITYSQGYGRGLIINDSLYASSPYAAPLMRGDYHDVPPKYSLKEYAPTPGYQGLLGTCSGWCTAYSARTILEAIKNGWNHSKTNANAFSPSFVYNQIRKRNNCTGGTSLIDALDVLKEEGCVKLNKFGYDCSREVTKEDKIRASKYKIIEYRRIANSWTENKSMYVKKSISNNRPVVIALNCPLSFNNAKKVWNPNSSDYKLLAMPGHGITVIGYDDNKYGGAFEVENSWGTNWGNKGFTWIRYYDFQKFCAFAFEVLDKSNNSSDSLDLRGSLRFRDSKGNDMISNFNGKYFVMKNSYPAGTLFELRISNSEPAYVYALGLDNTDNVTKIFPYNERMLAYLPYKQNDVAIPDEDHFNMIDSSLGPSYYCFLYSKKELDIDTIISKLQKDHSDIETRLKGAIGDIQVDNTNIEFNDGNEIKFSAKSKGKELVPILVEIPKPFNK